jgi:hypothetical protein
MKTVVNLQTGAVSTVALSSADTAEIAARQPTLADVKLAKIAKLALARDAAITANTVVGARTWPSTDVFKLRLGKIISRIGRGKASPANFYPLVGDVFNSPTIGQLEAIEDAIAAQEDAAHDNFATRVATVTAATTIPAVEVVVW